MREDPRFAVLAERWPRLDAAGFIQAMADEEADAPHFDHLGLAIEKAEPGRVVLRWTPARHLCNPGGMVHGGYLSVVLDDAAGLASASISERFIPMLTMDLRIDFIRPAHPDRTYEAVGTIVHEGSARRISDARIYDGDGRLIARATGTFTPNRAFASEVRTG
jgi:uncharacterized protein (TIGR00369 family)